MVTLRKFWERFLKTSVPLVIGILFFLSCTLYLLIIVLKLQETEVMGADFYKGAHCQWRRY